MENKNIVRGLGAALIDKKSYLFLCNDEGVKQGTFIVRESSDGINFETLATNAKIVNINGPSDDIDQSDSFHVSKDGRMYYLTYRLRDDGVFCIARSKNLVDWEKISELDDWGGNGKIVTNYLYAGRSVMYAGGDTLNVYVSEDLKKWSRVKKELVCVKDGEEKEGLKVVDVQVVDDGVFVMYSITRVGAGQEQCILHGALFDYGDPTKMLWQLEQPIYETENIQEDAMHLFGAVVFDEYFVSYWTNNDGEMFLLRHCYKPESGSISEPADDDEEQEEEKSEIVLERAPQNPIISPRCGCAWEEVATHNPAAIEHDGKIHIIYRADGAELLAKWGYASTLDGVTINDRSAYCIYQRKIEPVNMSFPAPVSYTSGANSNGGCEDPRAVLIDGRVYVTFTAFDGWGSVRVGLTSIDFEDFKNKRWDWEEARLISPPGEMAKNWMLFSEKVNGKFALLHSFRPEILIEYFDSLDELDGTKFIKSNNTRPVDPTRTWDSWFRCVGPPPLKTKDGWLVFYQAMDHRNSDRYRMGALLLDLDDPTKELYRSKSPILEPEEHYENCGNKWGVVFACGAVIKDDQVFVYYGGADKFVCVATIPLQQLLDDLKNQRDIRMKI